MQLISEVSVSKFTVFFDLLFDLFQVLSVSAVPAYSYLGMFAGPTKPKPFERKRANLTQLKQSKMPALTKVAANTCDVACLDL